MLNDLIEQNTNNWQSLLIFSGICLVIAFALYLVIIQVLKRISKKKDNNLEITAHRRFRIPLLILLLSLAVNLILNTLQYENDFFIYLTHAIRLVIIFGITWLVIRIINLGRRIVLIRYNYDDSDNLHARKVYTQFRIIERILIAMVVIISLAIALMTFDGIRKIGVSLFASAGVAGIIIGFAAQKFLGNVVAGVQIAIAQPIRLDDVVIVEGEWGWIEEITLTYVVVRIWDKRRLIVPTTYFIEKPFQNWTRESADILGTVYIYTDYNVPFDALREELTRILESDQHWDKKVNVLQVTNATDRTVEVRALVSAADSPSAWDLRVNIREKLIVFLQENYPESLPRTRVKLESETETGKTPSKDTSKS